MAQILVPVGVVLVEKFAGCLVFRAALGAQGAIDATFTDEKLLDGDGCDREGTEGER